MGRKLEKREWPSGHGPDDFQCFGPPATVDGQFAGTRIVDMGCFKQDGVDSNKYYHGAVVKSKKNSGWFAYFEWGRTGNANKDFQFIECSSETEAQADYEKQMHAKNDKRGEWTTVAGMRVLRAKAGDDCYLVRPQATRSTGLPDARSICANDGAKAPVQAAPVAKKGKKSGPLVAASKPKVDPETLRLMRDLNVATVSYTRGAMASGSLPTQGAIDEGRKVLTEAKKRISVVGDNQDAQVGDRDLNDLTSLLYGRIPKKKPIGAPPSTWLLSKNNIMSWESDLDAFEAALYSSTNTVQTDADPLGGMPLEMAWIDPKSSMGNWLHGWAPRSTRNRHGYGPMKIFNAWRISRQDDEPRFGSFQDTLLKKSIRFGEQPLHQPNIRPETDDNRSEAYKKTNTGLLWHGTRSVNVSGILRKSLLMPSQLVGVVITGAMFGGGLYFADDWMKSAGYTSMSGSIWSSGSGGVANRRAFMFLFDVILGNPFVAPGPRGYTGAPDGHHCIFGKAGHSNVQNNEWIVFNSAQAKMRYLLEFDTR
jgi:hypothetical protein